MKNKWTKHLVLVLLPLIMSACDSSRIYEDYRELKDAFWHVDSVQVFAFEVPDAKKSYNVIATFRNEARYPFYNIYFKYTLLDSSRHVLTQQLTSYNFFHPKTGVPRGDGMGNLFDHKVMLEQGYTFASEGVYSLELQQFMRTDSLPYVLSVGARIEVEK